jgi:Uma2 family endonuclease
MRYREPVTESAMVAPIRRKTIDDLHAMPDDGRLYELIDGEIIVSAAPGEPHLWVVKRLVALLLPLEFNAALGWVYIAPAEVHLPSGDVVEPDLFFIRKELRSIRRRSHVEGAPSVVFEVLSPTSRHRDLIEKRALYEAAGVPEYWIIDPTERRVLALIMRKEKYVELPRVGSTVESEVLTGFAIDVEALFADLP